MSAEQQARYAGLLAAALERAEGAGEDGIDPSEVARVIADAVEASKPRRGTSWVATRRCCKVGRRAAGPRRRPADRANLGLRKPAEPSGEAPLTSAAMPAEGDEAPDFTLPDQDGHEVSLADLRGRTTVLYFYPRADTPGCTTQASGIRDHSTDYEAAGVRVIGVSPDTVSAIKKFADKQSLDFTLLADEDHSVAERYGVWVEKSMYGKKYMGVQRSTFIIDADGKIAKVFPKVSPKTHDDVVLKALAEL